MSLSTAAGCVTLTRLMVDPLDLSASLASCLATLHMSMLLIRITWSLFLQSKDIRVESSNALYQILFTSCTGHVGDYQLLDKTQKIFQTATSKSNTVTASVTHLSLPKTQLSCWIPLTNMDGSFGISGPSLPPTRSKPRSSRSVPRCKPNKNQIERHHTATQFVKWSWSKRGLTTQWQRGRGILAALFSIHR